MSHIRPVLDIGQVCQYCTMQYSVARPTKIFEHVLHFDQLPLNETPNYYSDIFGEDKIDSFTLSKVLYLLLLTFLLML